MKKLIPLLLVLVLMLCLLGGCVTANTVHDPVETTAGGQTVTVQYDDGSITTGTVTSAGGNVYRFEVYFGDNSVNVDIVYPNGETYEASRSNGGFSSNFSFLTAGEYIDTLDLLDAIEEARPRTAADLNWAMILVSIVMVILGIVGISSPEALWTANKGWLFKNAEASTASLVFYRILGGILILAGGLVFVSNIF